MHLKLLSRFLDSSQAFGCLSLLAFLFATACEGCKSPNYEQGDGNDNEQKNEEHTVYFVPLADNATKRINAGPFSWARDQHSSSREKDYLKSRLYRTVICSPWAVKLDLVNQEISYA
jgi:hypothetical protein